jgi:hypothetical protein
MNSSMNTAKNMASSAVSAFANIPAVSENVDKTFNRPGFTKEAAEYVQSKLRPAPAPVPPPPPKAEKWSLPLKVAGVLGASVVLYFIFGPKAPKMGRPLGVTDESDEPPPKSKLWWLSLALFVVVAVGLLVRYLPVKRIRSWFAKMWKASPARSGTLSSRRSYYPPRSCRYHLRTK